MIRETFTKPLYDQVFDGLVYGSYILTIGLGVLAMLIIYGPY